jgi:hypothetical protein
VSTRLTVSIVSPTPSYPARFHDHDPAAVELREYHEARAALDAFVHATVTAGVEMTQRDLIDMAVDFAATNVYGEDAPTAGTILSC